MSAENPAVVIARTYPKAGMALAQKIASVAHNIGANPYDLADLINFESGMTFSSSVENPHSGATGLIQFMPSTARKLGTSTAALAAMTPVQQMVWVQRYFERVKSGGWDDKQAGPLDTRQALYMAVFFPWARYWPSTKRFDSITQGRNVEENNPGITTPASYIAKANRLAKFTHLRDTLARGAVGGGTLLALVGLVALYFYGK